MGHRFLCLPVIGLSSVQALKGKADFSEHSPSVPPGGLEVYCLMLRQYFSSSSQWTLVVLILSSELSGHTHGAYWFPSFYLQS